LADARSVAANISFNNGLSPNACGNTFVRRRSSPNSRYSRFVVRIVRRWFSGTQVGDAGIKVVQEAYRHRRQIIFTQRNVSDIIVNRHPNVDGQEYRGMYGKARDCKHLRQISAAEQSWNLWAVRGAIVD